MKKRIFLIMISIFCFGNIIYASDYYIGVVTAERKESEDSYLGAKRLERSLRNITKKGKIKHVTFTYKDTLKKDEYKKKIIELANNSLVKAILVVDPVKGTLEAFREVRKKHPKMILVASNPYEKKVADVADVVLNRDNVARGYLIVKAAQEMGAKNFVHLSFPREMRSKVLKRRIKIMKQTAIDLGMKFISLNVPDPKGKMGVEKAKESVYKSVPKWIKKYGEETAFFITNSEETEPLIKGISESGGYFVETDLSSSILEYKDALNLEIERTRDWDSLIETVEEKVLEKSEPYKLGGSVYSYNYIITLAMGKHLVDVLEKHSKLKSFRSIIGALEKETGGAGWNSIEYFNNKKKGVDNTYSFYQDTYVFGHGYMYMTDLEIPEKYLEIE